MNRDQVHKIMTGVAIGGSLVAGFFITQHEVAEHTIALPNIPIASGPNATASQSNSAAPVTKQGDLFTEQIFGGQVQLSVTKENGAITNINLDTATATGGREQVFSYLVQEAIAANGSNIANMSQATYTTDVFKQALDSALSKF